MTYEDLNTFPKESESSREYWIRMMDNADLFMKRIKEYPVIESGEPMYSLTEAVERAEVEVRFSERPHANGLPRQFYMRRSIIPQFIAAAKDFNKRGWLLMIEDAYRTTTMQRNLGLQEKVFKAVLNKVQWECRCDKPPIDLLCRRIASLVANDPGVATHMSGSAVDLSVIDRDSGEEVDRGAHYLEMSELTPMGSSFISKEAQINRIQITEMMKKHGFTEYPWEFWHYCMGDAYSEYISKSGMAAKYGPVDLDPDTGNVTPVDRSIVTLNSPAAVKKLMEAMLSKQERPLYIEEQ